MTKDDSLPRFAFWNFDSLRMKDYFTLHSGMRPEPNVVNIKKFVFVNASNRRVVPAVHHFGCADAPWRAGNAQCFYASLGPYEQAEFEVLGAVDLFILGWAPQQIVYSSMDLAKPAEVAVTAIFDDMALTKDTLPIVRANLGPYSFAARSEAFSATTKGFYLEEP